MVGAEDQRRLQVASRWCAPSACELFGERAATIRSGRFEAPKGMPFVEAMENYVRRDAPVAAE